MAHFILVQEDLTNCGGTLTLECGYYCNASATIQTLDGQVMTEPVPTFNTTGMVLYHMPTIIRVHHLRILEHHELHRHHDVFSQLYKLGFKLVFNWTV